MVGKSLHSRRNAKLYGVWLNSRKRHKMTFNCFLLKLRGMKFTDENIQMFKNRNFMSNVEIKSLEGHKIYLSAELKYTEFEKDV